MCAEIGAVPLIHTIQFGRTLETRQDISGNPEHFSFPVAAHCSDQLKFHHPVKYRFHYFSRNDVKGHNHSHKKKERNRKLTKSEYFPDWHEREKKCASNDQ